MVGIVIVPVSCQVPPCLPHQPVLKSKMVASSISASACLVFVGLWASVAMQFVWLWMTLAHHSRYVALVMVRQCSKLTYKGGH